MSKDFDKSFNRMAAKMGCACVIGVVLTIAANLALLGGAVWLVVWILKVNGII